MARATPTYVLALQDAADRERRRIRRAQAGIVRELQDYLQSALSNEEWLRVVELSDRIDAATKSPKRGRR